MRPQSKGSSAKISLQKNRKYATNRQLIKNSEDFNCQQQSEVQPLVHMNLMNGLDSRNNIQSNIVNQEKNKASTCYQTKQNSRQISPNRSQGRDDNVRARSYHNTEQQSQSIRSGNMVSASNQKVTVNYANMYNNQSSNFSNTGIQIKKQQQNNKANSKHR